MTNLLGKILSQNDIVATTTKSEEYCNLSD